MRTFLFCGRSIAAGVILLTCGFCAKTAAASGFVYQFTGTFSGGAPGGNAPWLDATFQDTSGGVLFTVDSAGLADTEYLRSFFFNLNPAAGNVKNLTFTLENKTGSFTPPTIQTGNAAYSADGDGSYDVELSFATTKSGRFQVGDSTTYLISGIAGLTAADFDEMCTPASGLGPYYAAAHIQGIPEGDSSGWLDPCNGPIFVPEPAPALVMGLAAVVMGIAHLRLRRARA